MPAIRIDLDKTTYRRLAELAINERRPIAWEAEVLLMRVLGLPAPTPQPEVSIDTESQGEPYAAAR